MLEIQIIRLLRALEPLLPEQQHTDLIIRTSLLFKRLGKSRTSKAAERLYSKYFYLWAAVKMGPVEVAISSLEDLLGTV